MELSGVDALLIHLQASIQLHSSLGHRGTSHAISNVRQPKTWPGQRSAALLHAPSPGSSGWWRSTCLQLKGSFRPRHQAAGQVEVHDAALQRMPDLLQRLSLVVLHGASGQPVIILEPSAADATRGCLLSLLSYTHGAPGADLSAS